MIQTPHLKMKYLQHGLALLLALFALASQAQTPDARMSAFERGGLRGFTLADLQSDGTEIYSESDYRDMVATGANVVRLFLHLSKCPGCEQYGDPDAEIRYAERVLARGEALGFGVIVSLLPLPGFSKADYWDSPVLQADIVEKWGLIAKRLKSSRALLAYDLINEPVVPGLNVEIRQRPPWRQLALTIAARLRAIDPHTPLMYEPIPWAFPEAFGRLEPLPFRNVVYSFHFYAPREFTHQGLYELPAGVDYPGGGWDKAALSRAMQPVRDFVRQHGVPVFVGEFSCVRWSPGQSCPKYIADAIELFEAERWGWAYLGWRGYQGWDAELPQALPREQRRGRLPESRSTEAPVIAVLRRYLARQPSPAR